MLRGSGLICFGTLAGCGAEPLSNVAQAPPQQVPAPREITANELAGPAGGLCAAEEFVVFQCAAGRKRVAICAGRSRSGQQYAQYRFGTPERIELIYPTTLDEGAGAMSWARTGYSGGGEMQVRFASRGHEYLVYSRVVRTGFGPDGHFDPRFESGVMVVRGNRLVSDVACEEPPDPWVHEEGAEQFIPEGEFFPWWDLEGLPQAASDQ